MDDLDPVERTVLLRLAFLKFDGLGQHLLGKITNLIHVIRFGFS